MVAMLSGKSIDVNAIKSSFTNVAPSTSKPTSSKRGTKAPATSSRGRPLKKSRVMSLNEAAALEVEAPEDIATS
jgi:hypothetical protein